MTAGEASARSSAEKLRQEYPLQDFRYRDDETREAESDNDLEHGPLLPTAGLDGTAESVADDNDKQNEPRRSRPGLCPWLRGPTPPHVHHIQPWLPQWQAAPARMIDQWLPRRNAKIALLLGGLIFWIVVFFSSLKSSVAEQEIPGYGQPVKLSCHDRLWFNATNCGLNGDLCQPFDQEGFAFRCPAGCSQAILLEPYNVGEQELNYRPLVIGGSGESSRSSGNYRGDSSICVSALHGGLVDDASGGCAILRRTGAHSNFQSVERNGIESIGFPSSFPMSFVLTRETTSSGSSEATMAECSDIRWSLFTFSVVLTTILSLSVVSAPAFFTSIFFIVWFQVAMSSDPPSSPNYYELVSAALGRFLPGAFVGFALYYFFVRHTLRDLDAHWDKTVLWLGGCWVGALNTDTFDRIPISRLTPHDLQQQPGAITALIIIVCSLVAIAIGQAVAFWREGRFPKMFRLYVLLIAIVLLLIAVPHMNLRIHHYILSLLLLPGTTLQTRPSLLYQGILVGLFINGIARWGFDSILQTPGALLDGARLGTTPPDIGSPIQPYDDNNTIIFNFPLLNPRVNGLSVLINDVERFHALRPKGDTSVPEFEWTRQHEGEPEFFRFGFIRINALGGVWYEDFSDAAVWDVDGSWVPPLSRLNETVPAANETHLR
ncbi:hypothetical protein N7474_001740 [Penicillium riverlandense]|uniref:uncharacterized protein n=1 Tax=Penicillium riverlandense TaxID=1903569 RepID=UPI002546CA5C|nr:uncharacterized protein N7474_001740 [Penicillium riverlandense]KAJ5833429.1 hypothetical protein N7474_001740 [Penicillium riverlandense]